MRATTKIPPWGAINFISAKPTNAPAKAEPAIKLGIARIGSAAPNGMAPSVIKDNPMTIFVKPEFLSSSSVNLFLNNKVAMKTASGGTIPPAITLAMTTDPPEATVAARVPVPKI